MTLSKKERAKLIGRVSRATGIAMYALDAKISDEDLIKVFDNLEMFSLIKSANTYNRYQQKSLTQNANLKTQEVKAENEELKNKLSELIEQFFNPQNSEIYRLGQWLVDSISNSGKEREKALLEQGLVHKTEYNYAVDDLKSTIEEQQQISLQQSSESRYTIEALERQVDSLRRQLSLIQDYITNNQSKQKWLEIAKYIKGNLPEQKIK